VPGRAEGNSSAPPFSVSYFFCRRNMLILLEPSLLWPGGMSLTKEVGVGVQVRNLAMLFGGSREWFGRP
jgi:hypothetical protein